MSRAGCIMVQGTMSGAGKSLLCAALCRIFAQDGYKTAPFKSQNMALNSFVTRDGLEMGRAQVVQAQAAGVEPDVRMNPILLKPSSDVGSQVIVNGEVRGDMPAKEYFRRKKSLIPDILRAYDSLADEFDIIVIEGAGSPAEINLKADDIVNMGLAKLVNAPVLLAGDFNTGNAAAVLAGLGGGFRILSDTTRMTFPSDNPAVRIDYILGRGLPTSATVAESAVDHTATASDHCPLWVTLVWKRGKQPGK